MASKIGLQVLSPNILIKSNLAPTSVELEALDVREVVGVFCETEEIDF